MAYCLEALKRSLLDYGTDYMSEISLTRESILGPFKAFSSA